MFCKSNENIKSNFYLEPPARKNSEKNQVYNHLEFITLCERDDKTKSRALPATNSKEIESLVEIADASVLSELFLNLDSNERNAGDKDVGKNDPSGEYPIEKGALQVDFSIKSMPSGMVLDEIKNLTARPLKRDGATVGQTITRIDTGDCFLLCADSQLSGNSLDAELPLLGTAGDQVIEPPAFESLVNALLLFCQDAPGKTPLASSKDGYLEFPSPILADENHWNPSTGGLTVYLLPGTLGKLRLRISASAGGLRVAIHTSSETGLVTLAAKRDELVNCLRAQGFSVAELVLLPTEPSNAREMPLGYSLERDQSNKSHQRQEKLPKQIDIIEQYSDEKNIYYKYDKYI